MIVTVAPKYTFPSLHHLCREENKWCREENKWCREENKWCREENKWCREENKWCREENIGAEKRKCTLGPPYIVTHPPINLNSISAEKK